MDDSSRKPTPRLGIIISMFPELHETFILRELVALERRGISFDIYSLQYPRDPITLDDAIRLSTERTHYSSLISFSTLAALFRTLLRQPRKLFSAVARVIVKGYDRPMDIVKNLAILPLALHIGEQGEKSGVVHWHGHWANVPTSACWFLHQITGVSWSAAIHGEDIFSANRFLSYKLDDALFSVVCSGHFCNHLKTHMGLGNPQNVHLNYHGLDPRVMERVPYLPSHVRSSKEMVSIISIGRLVPTKGHDILIRACAKLIREGIVLRLQLIGSGPLDAELKALAQSEGIGSHIEFSGAMAFDDVLESLQAADLFCLAPRLIPGQPPDGIPNVIAEAMALYVPVISTRVSAIPELIIDGVTGRLVEVDDVDGLASAIKTVASDPVHARSLSEQAAEHVGELFNQEQNIDELLSYFERHAPHCLAGSQPGEGLSTGSKAGS